MSGTQPVINPKFALVEKKVNDVKVLLRDGIEIALGNVDKLHVQEAQSLDLLEDAKKFKLRANAAKKKKCWQVYKWRIFVCMLILFTVGVVVLLATLQAKK